MEFDKWAAVEAGPEAAIPEGMESLSTSGLYAVFIHRGPASQGPSSYQYIFGEWMPASAYEVDQRLHMAVMGEKYKNEDPASEEELWIPVRHRS